MISQIITEKLQQFAKEKGANSVKLITVKNIFIKDWVRQKCNYGCSEYAKHFTCPPYSPTPEETRKRLQAYKQALLVEFIVQKEEEGLHRVHETMYELEREAFLDGLYKAFSYSAGPCRICRTCRAERIDDPNKYHKKECKNPKKARPAMEACGIDVFQTVRKAGYEIDVVRKEDEYFKFFGLLLLE